MRHRVRRFSTVSRLGLAASLLLAACSSSGDDAEPSSPSLAAAGAAGAAGEEVSCTDDARVDAFAEGLKKTGAKGFTVSLDAGDPEPPARGDNGWSVTLLDADGQPLSGARLVITAKMPDHGHMSPTTPEASPSDEQGQTSISGLNLFMAGVWVVELGIMAADAADTDKPLDSVSFAFCVEG